MSVYTLKQVHEMWKRPWEEQIEVARAKCMEVVVKTKGNLYVNFSGGKDSTVLLYLMAEAWSIHIMNENNRYHAMNVFFADTTLEFKDILDFVPEYVDYIEKKFDIRINLIKVKAEESFFSVVRRVGMPFISKRIAKGIRCVRKDIRSKGYTYRKDIEPLLPDSLTYKHIEVIKKSAEKLKSMRLSVSTVSALLGITGDGNFNRNFVISKQYRPLIDSDIKLSEECCNHLKKSPIKLAKRYFGTRMMPIIGEMAQDSYDRLYAYMDTGCNSFDSRNPISKPLGPMTEQALLTFIDVYEIPYAKVYGDLLKNDKGDYYFTRLSHTGCKLCGFGLKFTPNKFILLYEQEPKLVDYCFTSLENGGLGYGDICKFLNENCGMHIEIPPYVEGTYKKKKLRKLKMKRRSK